MSDKITFDLAKERWLPCLDLQGKPMKEELSLRDVFAEAHRVSAIQGDSPLVTIALYRFLLTLLYHTMYLNLKRPTKVDDWQRLWEQRRTGFEMRLLDDYFQRFNDRFDLFHSQYPFYQNSDAMGKKGEQGDSFSKSVAELVPEISWGNNATLLDHRFERDGFSLSSAEAARRLIAIQAFGLQGLSGFTKKNYRNAPLVDSVILLAQGDTVFETLVLNMQLYPIKGDSNDNPWWDSSNMPEWEDARSADNEGGYAPRGLLDYLTWQNRLVLLKPPESREDFVVRKMKMSRGYKLKLDEAEFDPMKSFQRKKKKEKVVYEQLRWDENRALWRDSTTLFSVHVKESKERPPRAFHFISDLMIYHNLPLDISHRYRFSAFGLSPQQASVNFFRHETFPLPLEYLRDPEAFQKFKANMAYAEKMGKKLENACAYIKARLYPGSDKPSKTTQKARAVFTENVKRHYWTHLQTLFFPMMLRTATEVATRDQETTQWHSQVDTAVQIAFDEAIASLGTTAKAYELYVRGYEKIWPTKRKKKGDDEKMEIDKPTAQNKQVVQARRFVAYLQRLKASDKGAGAMAEMRHTLNHSAPPETQPMFKYIARWMNEEGIGYKEYMIQPLCLTASLFALHPDNVDDDSNMGTHLAMLCPPRGNMNPESVERRFSRLLETSFDELPNYLAQIVRLLKSREQGINYARLLADIQQWNEPTFANQVKRRWAREFWFRVTTKNK
jgi:CRISPR system Cascade subunit CasA